MSSVNLHPVKFNLSESQQQKVIASLKSGSSVTLRLSPQQIGTGTTHLACTPSQIKRIQKKKQQGVGCELTFSIRALRHSAKIGGGLFRNLVSGGVRFLGNTVADTIKGGRIYRKSDCGPMRAPKQAEVTGDGFFRNVLASGVRGIGNIAADTIKGGRVSRSRLPNYYNVTGSGFLAPGY